MDTKELTPAGLFFLFEFQIRAISRSRGVPDGRFNALHVRVESDWILHCKNWEIPGMRDNCMTHTEHLDQVLAIEGARQI